MRDTEVEIEGTWLDEGVAACDPDGLGVAAALPEGVCVEEGVPACDEVSVEEPVGVAEALGDVLAEGVPLPLSLAVGVAERVPV